MDRVYSRSIDPTHVPSRSQQQVFCELERALTNELDFLAEAQAMEKVRARIVCHV